MRRFSKSIARWPEESSQAARESSGGAGLPELIFLSHCVPNPPDKGEKIRAYHELNRLATRYRVQLVCFARSRREIEEALELKDRCASIYVELLSSRPALARAAARFAVGGCLTTSFYYSGSMMRHVRSLCGRRIFATLAYSSAMAQYAPREFPLFFDLIDVDSEKWLEFAGRRRPGFLYRMEALRLRDVEAQSVRQAARTVVVTEQEQAVLRQFVPERTTTVVENGVDFDYYDPSKSEIISGLEGRKVLVFVGAMDYYPNADAVGWFAANVFGPLRKRVPELEFLIVGRNPSAAVRGLAREPGITVTGSVPDVRPYLASAMAVVAPLRIARGVQNKVLEALAMGRRVLASPAVARCFGSEIPRGVVTCGSPEEFLEAAYQECQTERPLDPAIREGVRQRFSWQTNLTTFCEQLDSIEDARWVEPAVGRASWA